MRVVDLDMDFFLSGSCLLAKLEERADDQQMVIVLLREMQEEEDGVLSRQSLEQIAPVYAMKESLRRRLMKEPKTERNKE